MPRIPEKRIAGPTRTERAVRIPDVSRMAGVQQEIAQLTSSITKVLAEFQKIDDNRDTAKGLVQYNQLMTEHEKSLIGKDPEEYMKSLESLRPQINNITKGMSRNVRENLRNRFTLEYEADRARTAQRMVVDKKRQIIMEYPQKLQEFAENGQKDDAMNYIDGFSEYFSPAERKAMKREYENYEAFSIAITKPDKKSAYDYIDSLKILPEDKRIVSNKVADYFAQLGIAEQDKVQKAILDQRKTIDDFTKELIDPIRSVSLTEVEKGAFALPDFKDKWEKIVQGQTEKPPTKTDWEEYNKLENRLFDYWEGKYDSKKEDLQTQFAEAYLVGRKLTKEQYEDLVSRLNDDIPDTQRKYMKAIFNARRIKSEKKGVFNLWTNEKAKRVSEENKALYDWTKKKLADGKLPTYKDMLEMSDDINASSEELLKSQYLSIKINPKTGEMIGYNGKEWKKIQ